MRERLSFMYLSHGGRIGRRDYWLFFVVPAVLLVLLRSVPGSFAGSGLETLLIVVVLWPAICVQTKRWHDVDLSGWWVLVNAVPVAGWLMAWFINGFLPGTRGENQYGEEPLAESER